MSIVKDRIRPLDPSSHQEFLGPDREDIRDAPEPHIPAGETRFELESRGGYVRTVTGTVAYLDEDAQTYMVLRGNGDGELIRVPLRDITAAHETDRTGRSHVVTHDAEGINTRR